MRKPILTLLAIIVLLASTAICLADPAAEQRFREANAAYGRGEQGKAAELLREAAELGHAEAQFNLGILYHNAQGVSLDYPEAFKWYGKAAEQGHARAQVNVGMYYYYGVAVEADPVEAYVWYSLALAGGEAQAKANLDYVEFELTAEQLAAAEQRVIEKAAEIEARRKTGKD